MASTLNISTAPAPAGVPSSTQSLTRSVKISSHGEEEDMEVMIQEPSQATLALRRQVDRFIRASHVIWAALPESKRGLLATPDVLTEVIHCATAFHVNEVGKVNLVWLKKDMPKEALEHSEVGYWTAAAGPAARAEQWEIEQTRLISPQVMDYIRRTNDHAFISHFLYPFIDVWVLVLWHILTWLACLFWYGYLCLLCPTILVGESSKLLNIFLRFTPQDLFRPDLPEEDLAAFLNGVFTLPFLQSLCLTTSFEEWEDLEMDSHDFLQAIGVPIIVHYGPLAHNVGIFIPKYHPYGANHILTLRVEMDDLDRQIRLLIELSLKFAEAAATIIPTGPSRRDYLVKVRASIMQKATELGILAEMERCKNILRQSRLAFIGTNFAAQTEATGAGTNPGQNPAAK
jgi:hypothetical protein